MRYAVLDFSMQLIIFLKGQEVDRLSVLAETLKSNELAPVTRRLVYITLTLRRKFQICPTTFEPNYLFVLAILL